MNAGLAAPQMVANEDGRDRGLGSMERTIAVLALGLASLGIYFFALTLPYSLSRYYATPLLDLAKINHYTFENGWNLIGALIALFLIYAAVWLLMPRTLQISQGLVVTVILLPLVFSMVLIFVYPVGAADIFDYIMHARLLPVYGANPFAVWPVQFKGDPFLRYIAWPYTTSAYGPLWELVAAGVSWLGGDNLWRNLIYFKGLAVISYFANALLIYVILKRHNPEWLWRGMVFYLWNPLVLFEIAVNGHNDLLMMTGVLLAIVALDWKRATLRYGGASAFLALGALVKFLAVLLLPLFWIESWQRLRGQPLGRRARIVALGIAAALLLAIAFYLPFYAPGVDILSAQRRSDMFTASIPNGVRIALQNNGFTQAMAQEIARDIALALLGLFYLWQMWQLWRGRTTLLRASFEVLFFYLLISVLWFQPWYLLWLVALAPLIPDWGVQVRTYAFCVTAMANYIVWDMLFFWVYRTLDQVSWGSVYVVYPIPILLSLGFLIHGWWRRRKLLSVVAPPAPLNVLPHARTIVWEYDSGSAPLPIPPEGKGAITAPAEGRGAMAAPHEGGG